MHSSGSSGSSAFEMPQQISAPQELAAAPPLPLRPVAPIWHTVVLIAFLMLLSFAGARSSHKKEEAHQEVGYAVTIALEWLLFGFVAWGLRLKGLRLRDVTGPHWKSAEQALIDFLLAIAGWIAILMAVAPMAVLAEKLKWVDTSKLQEMRKAIDFLVPHTPLQIVIFAVLCVSAGICEETIYRGYLQRQLGAGCRSLWLGTLASAILFGLSHGYQGILRMGMIAMLGFVLGTLANLRRNLRPGMMTHAWFDFFSGVVGPRLMKVLPH